MAGRRERPRFAYASHSVLSRGRRAEMQCGGRNKNPTRRAPFHRDVSCVCDKCVSTPKTTRGGKRKLVCTPDTRERMRLPTAAAESVQSVFVHGWNARFDASASAGRGWRGWIVGGGRTNALRVIDERSYNVCYCHSDMLFLWLHSVCEHRQKGPTSYNGICRTNQSCAICIFLTSLLPCLSEFSKPPYWCA